MSDAHPAQVVFQQEEALFDPEGLYLDPTGDDQHDDLEGFPQRNPLTGNWEDALVSFEEPFAQGQHLTKAGRQGRAFERWGEFVASQFRGVDAEALHRAKEQRQVESWLGLAAAPNTPQPIVARLNNETHRALDLPEGKKWATDSGVVPAPSTPEEFRKRVENDVRQWTEIVVRNNITVQ